jgi:uncharacterized protein (TIGR02594 family)
VPWLQEAYNLMGTREKPGAGSNEAITGWAEAMELTSYSDDDIPWCGLFVAHCLGSQLPEETLPRNVLGARNWARAGIETTPRLGAIMVFWRGSPNGWKGHVGFYWAEDDDAFHILGGNQSDAVTITRLSRDRLLEARWPATAPAPDTEARRANVHGRLLSTDED